MLLKDMFMPVDNREITYAAALREAIDDRLKEDPAVFIIGEGVTDPKGIFGTTSGLLERYGAHRVSDMPVSENALTGVCIGAALRGLRPIMTHQRVDFALLSLDQIINNAAKWYFMFGGQTSVPLVIRMIIGQGWGQGAQHSQNLQALFAHIPGLKVIMPVTPYDAKGMLIAAVKDPNPVICLEHRWLYNLKGYVPEVSYTVDLGQAKVIREGTDITVVASSYMTVEALKAAQVLEKAGISPELIDLRTIRPLDRQRISQSVKKTGRLLVVDSGWTTGGIAGEIITQVVETLFHDLRGAPSRIALPDIPTPSSPGLTKNFYPGCRHIVERICAMLQKGGHQMEQLLKGFQDDTKPHDVPDLSFTGPF
jgi:pyruvate dehydrogenase E1 component beta subunit